MFRAACVVTLGLCADLVQAAPDMDDFRRVFSSFPYRMLMDRMLAFRMGDYHVFVLQNRAREAGVIIVHGNQAGNHALEKAKRLQDMLGEGGKVVPFENNPETAAIVYREALPSRREETTLVGMGQLELFAHLYRMEALRPGRIEESVLIWNIVSSRKKVAELSYPIMRTSVGLIVLKMAGTRTLNNTIGKQLLRLVGCTPQGGSKGIRLVKSRNIRLYAEKVLFYDEETDDCATIDDQKLCIGKRYEVAQCNKGANGASTVYTPRISMPTTSVVESAPEPTSEDAPAVATIAEPQVEEPTSSQLEKPKQPKPDPPRVTPPPLLTPAQALEEYRKFLREL